MPTGSEPTSPTPHHNLNGNDRKISADNTASNNGSSGHSNGSSKLPTVSYDHTSYVQRARVTRPAPPKPSANPMQFVQIKPCNLYQSAQEQLKRAEEVKKVKEIKKEEPEDWQSNLDNWKSCRRKRVEHIIDRVVEVKKLELEEHDRTRRKSKTFSEMMEEKKCSRRATKLAAIVYAEDESNDLSDLGIGTSSASGKSSLSEDYDNQSVMSDNVDNDKHSIDLDHQSNHDGENGGPNRGYTSSPGYDTSSSTAPASSPDPCEYTYEGAIQDYKTRISKAQSSSYNNGFRNNLASNGSYSKDSTPERTTTGLSENNFNNIRRPSAGSKIEDRLMSFEIKSASDLQSDSASAAKKDLPKVDILKRRELFEKENAASVNTSNVASTLSKQGGSSNDFSNSKSIKERLSSLEKTKAPVSVPPTVTDEIKKPASNRLSGDISTIKDRLQILEKQTTPVEKSPKIDVPVVSLKDRLSSLQSAATKEETKKPVVLIDEYQLEMMKQEDMMRQQQQRQLMGLKDDASNTDDENMHSSQEILSIQDESNVDTDREDSGIHTTDVSCSVSQTDEQPELLVNEDSLHHHHHINSNDGLCHRSQEEEEHSIAQQNVAAGSNLLSPTLKQEVLNHADSNLEDRSLSISTPEPSNDLEASVSLSLSESPTTSSNTVIFDGGSDIIQQDMDQQKLTTNSVTVISNVSNNLVDDCSANRNSSRSITKEITALLTPDNSFSSKNNDHNTNNNEFTNILHHTDTNDSSNEDKNQSFTSFENIIVNRDINGPLSPKDRRKTVVEICEKRNVQTAEDAQNIPTPFLDVDWVDIGEPSPILKKKSEPVNLIKDICTEPFLTKTAAETCKKINVNNPDDANNIPTSFVNVNFEDIGKETPIVKTKSHPVNIVQEVKISDEVDRALPEPIKSGATVPSNPSKIPKLISPNKHLPTNMTEVKIIDTCTDIIKEEKGIVVAELEVITTEIKVKPQSPLSLSPPGSPTSPRINPKTHPLAMKPKNIFDFLKKNFNSSSEEIVPVSDIASTSGVNRRDTIAIDNSKFYVPVDTIEQTTSMSSMITSTPPSSPGRNEVNIQITKTTKTEKIVEKTDSVDSTNTMTSEINQLLDEELAKLTSEDTRL